MAETQQLQFEAPPEDPVSVYLASGLTSLNEDQITIVELVSGLIAGYCADAGVMVHQPVLHTHPKDHDDLSAQAVHAMDFRSVTESDAVIAIGDFASWGAGKELAWVCERRAGGCGRQRSCWLAQHTTRSMPKASTRPQPSRT